ncbi:MAG: hypothetical protein NVS3B24_23900 [Candidatus Dormibacteria bacterium]
MIPMALRRHRRGIITCGLIGVLFASAQTAAFASIAGSSQPGRAAFGAQMQVFGRQVSFLLALPVHPETFWGHYAWRGMGGILLMVVIWAALSGSGAARGDEEAGLVEMWLSTGIRRGALLASRVGAFAIAVGAVLLVAALAAAAGALHAGEPIPWQALLAQSALLAALAVDVFALSLLVSQFFATRGSAGGASGGLVGLVFLVNGLSRTVDVGPIALLSPFHAYDHADVLSPGTRPNGLAVLVVIGLSPVLLAASTWLFERRDIGGVPLVRQGQRAASSRAVSRVPLLKRPLLESFWEQRVGLVAWLVGLCVLGAFMSSLLKSMVDIVHNLPALQVVLRGFGPAGAGGTFLQALWFNTAQLLLAMFSVQQVSRWSDEDQGGRLAMLLSTPYPRWLVLAERAVALTLQLLVMVTVSGALVATLATAQGVDFSAAAFIRATLMLVPLALAFAAIGALVSGFAPRLAVPATGALAIASFLVQQVGPLLRWPDAVVRASLFHLYGTPITAAVDFAGLGILLLIVVAGFGGGTLLLRAREIGS